MSECITEITYTCTRVGVQSKRVKAAYTWWCECRALLVGACAASGTHYCDLTGEPGWVRSLIDDHDAAAVASGAKIVPCCGFDSVPADVGSLKARFVHVSPVYSLDVKIFVLVLLVYSPDVTRRLKPRCTSTRALHGHTLLVRDETVG